jgi:hypothetical protein
MSLPLTKKTEEGKDEFAIHVAKCLILLQRSSKQHFKRYSSSLSFLLVLTMRGHACPNTMFNAETPNAHR